MKWERKELAYPFQIEEKHNAKQYLNNGDTHQIDPLQGSKSTLASMVRHRARQREESQMNQQNPHHQKLLARNPLGFRTRSIARSLVAGTEAPMLDWPWEA
jgi:hypothetical protein